MMCDFKIKQVTLPFYAKVTPFPIKVVETTKPFKVLAKNNLSFNVENTTPKFKLTKTCCKR